MNLLLEYLLISLSTLYFSGLRICISVLVFDAFRSKRACMNVSVVPEPPITSPSRWIRGIDFVCDFSSIRFVFPSLF